MESDSRCVPGSCSKSRKKIWNAAKSSEQQALCGTMCSGFCMREFIFQMKVLDVERLCLLSKVTRMTNEERQGSSQGSVSSILYS